MVKFLERSKHEPIFFWMHSSTQIPSKVNGSWSIESICDAMSQGFVSNMLDCYDYVFFEGKD